ncbi:MAG: helix-turn-helix domain-containing protein, partial [Polyangiaceae bacterium]
IPPLRERKDDILALARASIVRTAKRLNRKAVGFTPAAAERLLAHPWPGNVRELENVVERAVVLCDDTLVDIDQLPSEILAAAVPSLRPGAILPLEEVERQYILAVLEANGGNRTKTAVDLRIGAATLYRKLKGYGLAVSVSR